MELDVLLNGRRVATLDGAAGAGLASLQYTDDVVDELPGAPLLSLRLPVRATTYPGVDVRAWMDGLVPEGGVRTTMASLRRLEETDLFGLLRHYGRDCAGAVTIVDPDDPPAALSPTVRWLTDDELVAAVRDLPQSPFGVGVDPKVRISLGGVQAKLAVVWDGARAGLPEGLAASTHILKPTPLLSDGSERYPGIVTAEAMCLRVCDRVGLVAPEVSILELETGPALLVKRYDRKDRDGSVTRVHQEDFAQALGITASLKYQEDGRNYPSHTQLVDLLRRHGAADAGTLRSMVRRLAVYGLLGNCDAHAKNWSLLLSDGTVALSPVYDVVPSPLWPKVTTILAMPVGSARTLEDFTAQDLRDEAGLWDYGARAVRRDLDAVQAAFSGAVSQAAQDVVRMGGDAAVVERVSNIALDRARSFF